MRHCPGFDMFNDDFHLGIIGETSILLLKAEMRWVEVYGKGRRVFRILLQNVGRSFH